MRYGHYSVAGEFVYDHPFQWGSKRTGPDLHRVGGLYSDEWHRIHLNNPRDVVPESNMPAYSWLEKAELDRMHVEGRVALLRIAAARAEASIALAKLAAAMRAAGCSEEMVEEHLEQSWLHGSKAVDAVGVQEPEGLWKHI
jgi:cbb3-type cytochrome c oxidase subunit II